MHFRDDIEREDELNEVVYESRNKKKVSRPRDFKMKLSGYESLSSDEEEKNFENKSNKSNSHLNVPIEKESYCYDQGDSSSEEEIELEKVLESPNRKSPIDREPNPQRSLWLRKQIRTENSNKVGQPETYFDLVAENLHEFVYKPAPQNMVIKCHIVRDRSGVAKSTNPCYYMQLERESGKKVFLQTKNNACDF